MIQDLDAESFSPLIVTVALTGAVPTKERYKRLPVTPQEIAEDALACEEAGASIVHIHMRDQNGKPTQDRELFAKTIQLIRQSSPELIICATTTSRGSATVSDRLSALQLDPPDLPDLASLTLGSYNTPTGVNLNPPGEILEILDLMSAVGVLPEVEVFEIGMIDTLKRLQNQGLIPQKSPVNLFFGVEGALAANPQNFVNSVAALPDSTVWSGAGIGRYQKTANALAIAMGGGVRVGMEDDPRGAGDDWSNLDAVRRAINLAASLGRVVSTPSETRKMLGLGK
jgi:3-keto-5-aminohexanoate cleavage enzyme